MIPRKESSRSGAPKAEPRTLDSVINETSIIQLPLIVLLLRGLPSAGSILGMRFLAPKIQNFTCTSFAYDMSSYDGYADDSRDPRCYTHVGTPCNDWSFDPTTFDQTFKSEFKVVCESEWIIGFSDTLIMVGMMLGNFIFSHISDWYGRRIANIGSVLFSFLGAIAMAASPNVVVFVILRTIMAMGLGGGQNGPVTLAMESVNPTKRAAISFCDSFGWILGLLLLPIAPWFYRTNWRYLQLILSLANIPLLITAIMADESPRWLLATGRKERARPVIKRLLKKNGLSHSDDDVEQVIASTPIIEKKEAKANILHLFAGRSGTITTLSFLLQFPISILVYYDMMFFVVDNGENPWLNVLYTGIFEIPCLFLVALLVKFGSRKVLYLILYVVAGVAAGGLVFTNENQETLRAALGTIAKTGAQLLFPILGVHVNETYITRKRGIALGLCTTFSRFGAITSPSLKDMGTTFHGIFNAGACLLGLAAALPLRETFNEPLPDTDQEDRLPDRRVRYSRSGDPSDANTVVENVEPETVSTIF